MGAAASSPPPPPRGAAAATGAPSRFVTPSEMHDLIATGRADVFAQLFPGRQMDAAAMAAFPSFLFPGGPAGGPRLESAASLKNLANVRRDSLQVVTDAAQPDLLYVAFDFDAEVPVRISVYPVCVEGPADSGPLQARISPKYKSSVCHVSMPAGMRQRFCQKALAEKPAAACSGMLWIDLRMFTDQELLHVPATTPRPDSSGAVPPNMYPLVIIIEAETQPVAAAAASAAATAQEQVVRVQATYASFVRKGGAGYDLRTLKQKVAVGDAEFVQKELYGLDGTMGTPGSPTIAATAAPTDGVTHADLGPAADTAPNSAVSDSSAWAQSALTGTECVVCLTERRQVAVLPCRHTCLCRECANQLVRCPVCRQPVTSLLMVAR